jgi:REP element-mobilizing transposase RayT
MKQQSFFKNQARAHGGAHSVKKRRTPRPMSTKHALHITLRSQFAKGQRSLLKHKKPINEVIEKASKQFQIQVYEKAICGNHIHLLIRGKTRVNLQNFFRVVAGHIAQKILESFPITKQEREAERARGGAPTSGKMKKTGCQKNQRKFWELLIYTRIITWGKEFKTVTMYIIQNTLEALNVIAYQKRSTRFSGRFNSS